MKCRSHSAPAPGRSGGGKPAKAVVYARSATVGRTIEAQVQDCLVLAGKAGVEVVAVFSDEGASGTQLNRPGLVAMLNSIRSPQVDVLIVQRLDRLSRNPVHLRQALAAAGSMGLRILAVENELAPMLNVPHRWGAR